MCRIHTCPLAEELTRGKVSSNREKTGKAVAKERTDGEHFIHLIADGDLDGGMAE